MSKIDEIKVRAYEQTKALLESKQNQKALIQKDLDACDADIAILNEELSAISVSFKTSITAYESAKLEVKGE